MPAETEDLEGYREVKERLISAAVGLALLFVWLFFFGTVALNIVLALLAALMLYELLSASKNTNHLFLLLISLVYALLVPFFPEPYMGNTGYIATFVYVLLLLAILLFQHDKVRYDHIAVACFASTLIPLSLSAAVSLRNTYPLDGLFYFIIGLGGAWLTDSCSFFVGTLLGKTKLAPDISPKKTVEGFLGGLAGGTLLTLAITYIYVLFCGLKGAVVEVSIWQALLFGFTASLLSVLGDLSASLIKRQCAVKDFGNIMPGHGGMLDRFDSVLIVLPYTYIFVSIFPIITRLAA